jgi:Arc/MetJ-type ribon-helix-helix transcriptional regulator
MEVAQVRLPKKLIEQVDFLVEEGFYASRSDALRDAVRKMDIKSMIGTIPNTGDSVKEVREIRKKLSKEKFNLEEINKLGE